MKAIRCREWGAPDVLRLEEADSPSLKPHQVRIRVRAAGVNFADSLMVGGTYQVKPPFPFTPGLEAAGEIVETGSAVDGLQAGQRVLAVLRDGGGYAEEIVLDAAAVVPIPDAMDFVTADRVVDDIGAFATGQRAHPVADAFLSIIDQLVCPPRARHCQFFRAASCGDDPRPQRFADLDRCQPDPTGGAQHEQGLVRLQMAAMRQR